MRRMYKRKRLLDFCSKAGGTSMGYHMAGFEVWGSDIQRQPNFPWRDRFYKFDITKLDDKQIANIGRNFDAVCGSPPCKGYSITKTLATRAHPKLVEFTRWVFEEIGLPYIIENVPGAPLIQPVQICGSGLGLRVQRHRYSETAQARGARSMDGKTGTSGMCRYQTAQAAGDGAASCTCMGAGMARTSRVKRRGRYGLTRWASTG